MLQSLALAALVGASSVWAQTKCDLDNKCPEDMPCCSQFGECGIGAYCLGGCDPRMSSSIDACVPAPVCKDSTTNFNSLDSIVDINNYLGDPKDGTWVSQGEPAAFGDSVLLTMPKGSSGTLLSSTSYMWYGNVKARMKTSRGKGVITAFILFSDVKDEIDYEWVGADLETSQTNYYFQGITNYQNSANISLSDTFNNYHEYEIRWTPDKIEWLVDGQVGRTKLRSETWNSKTQQWEFPQTPSRVQLSLWPGGLESSAEGTIEWAGGLIDWESEDIKKTGYYYATVSEVSIECFNSPTAPGTNSGVSYTYSSLDSTNNTVVDGDKRTTLYSLQGTGLDMDAGKPSKSESSSSNDDDSSSSSSSDDSKTTSVSKPVSTAPTIPGGGNGIPAGQDRGEADGSQTGSSSTSSGSSSGSSSDSSGSDSSSDSSSADSSSSSSSSGSSDCDTSSFNMNCDGSSSSSTDNGDQSGSSKTGASVLAMVIAGCALFWL